MAKVRLPSKFKHFEPVVIVWDDVRTDYGPGNSTKAKEEEGETFVRRSIGFVISSTRERIKIASHDDRQPNGSEDDNDCEDITVIRRSYIVSIHRLAYTP